ncbi:MAG: AraC family transcriptional regulator [Verrucomicrobia bacterium]|nr:AraC family transcriptional regulator [Verrucomicrobiota bacterium]MBU1735691.1 AraC family transcriptional regulator [Verrucomicrobiota bacterium]MBU1858086.1 AraC family transcriptional regulator [Verrucomicrobiota bacterium]
MDKIRSSKRQERASTIRRHHRAEYFGKTGMPLCVFAVHGEPSCLFHDHDFTELVVVLGGSGMHLAAPESYPIQVGDVFVIHENTGHAYQDTRNLKLINVLFDLNQLDLPVKDLVALEGYQALFVLEPRLRSAGGAHHHCRLSSAELGVMRELLFNLIHELERKPAGYQCMAAGLFLQAVGFLSRCYSRIRDPEPRAFLRLGQTLSYIENHYVEPVTLGQLAQSAGMSPSTLQRVFRRSFQTSPIDYLIGVRVQKSLELLAAGELNVTEAAFRVGFTDSNYFARQFRKHMGLSPHDFRRQTVARAAATR